MTTTNTAALTLTFTLLLVGESFANDTTARIAAGGVLLEKSDTIEMVSEQLEIAATQVSVKYIFHNHSSSDITKMVAFPLPLKVVNLGDRNEAVMSAESFKVWADDKPIPTRIIRAAVLKGKDVTSSLKKAGLSDEQIFDYKGCDYDTLDRTGSICGFSLKQQYVLKSLGIHDNDLWKVQETVVWSQTFPAAHDLKIRHLYTPGVGERYEFTDKLRFDAAAIVGDAALSYKDENNEACVDKSTLKAANNSKKILFDSGAKTVRTVRSDVEYILGTGRNWRGSIGDFTLRVTKSSPDDVVSLCFPGKPQKVSPLTYEFHQTNYTPQDSVIIYFYSFHTE